MDQPTSHINNGGVDIQTPVSGLTELPHDIFLLIISHLSPTESILCRRVSRSWNAAFSSDDASWNLMRWHFPRAREMRRRAVGAPDSPSWVDVFPKVARRYSYLRSATPRVVESIDSDPGAGPDRLFRGVEPWNRWLGWNGNVAVFQHGDPGWCLDDGLLIYRERASSDYTAYDLETGCRFQVPFDGADKIVRRLRLVHSTLVIEWCEREPYHLPDGGRNIHRHFATAFDVRRSTGSSHHHVPGSWEIRFRSEWRMHHPGLAVDNYDRFFSAHTAAHYALYIWRHEGPVGNGEDPIEQLVVWEMGDASLVRPSADGSADAGIPDAATGGRHPQPRVIKRLTGRALDFLGVRQRHTPTLRELCLDDANVYVHEETHRWLAGPHAAPSPPRHHVVRATGIPLSGAGPHWFDECCADGDIHLSFCPRAGSASGFDEAESGHHDNDYRRDGEGDGDDNGNDNDDDNGRTWLGRAPCWRHEEFPYLTVSDAVDAGAGVRIVARQCFVMEALSAFVRPRIVSRLGPAPDEDEPREVRFADDLWGRLLGRGKIAGDERWVVGEGGDGCITIVRF